MFEDERSERPPLVVLHGGPGVPSDYLLPLGPRLAAAGGRAVVLYDQLGCGASDRPEDETLYGVENAVAELADVLGRVRAITGHQKLHLLGQSWGGMLAFEGVLDGAVGPIASLTLSNSPADVGLVEAEAMRLMSELPAPHGDAVRAGPEEAGAEAFQAAVDAFMATHNCRADPKPEHVAAAYEKGATVWRGSGAIAGWTARDPGAAWPTDLHTLIVTGSFDFVTPACVQPWLELLPRSTWKLLEGGSHMPFNDDDEAVNAAFFDVVAEHLATHDG